VVLGGLALLLTSVGVFGLAARLMPRARAKSPSAFH